jgi:hypothetical protein
MAALTGSYDVKRKDGKLVSYPLAAGAHIYKGALVCVSAASGLVVPGADAAGVVFVGVAHEEGNNVAGFVPIGGGLPGTGAAGAVSVRVEKDGLYHYNKAGAVQTDVGKVAYILDDNTVSTAATTNNVHCGVVGALIDGGTLAVLIDGRTS